MSAVVPIPWRKYDVVRSESLHRGEGIPGSYRTLTSSPASKNVHRRPEAKSLSAAPTLDSGGARRFRRRIPQDLFDILPESRVDPDPPQMEGMSKSEIQRSAGESRKFPTDKSYTSGENFSCQRRTVAKDETLLRREGPEGTVFGILQTSSLKRGGPQQYKAGSGVSVVNVRRWNDRPDSVRLDVARRNGRVTECFNNAVVPECYNPHVRGSLGVTPPFHNFCRTMLSLGNGTSDDKEFTNKTWHVYQTDTGLRVAREEPCRQSIGKSVSTPVIGDSDSPTVVKEVLKKATSQPVESSNDVVADEQQDAMDVIKELDNTIAEADRTFPKVKKNLPLVQPDNQTDNLIEEVLAPGSNRRSYLSFPSKTVDKATGVDSLRSQYRLSKEVQVQEISHLSPNGLSVVVQNGVQEDGHENEKPGERSPGSDSSSTLNGAMVPRLDAPTEETLTNGNHKIQNNYFVVVAIDFGTTYSGYAFSFTRDPDKIHMMKKWEGGDPGLINQKTPTTLLLTPEGLFNSFGYAARDFYHDLEPEDAKKWLYFEKFKMTLHHSEDLSRETSLKAANGKTMPAITVFAQALKYFKDHALQELSDQSATRILNEDVRWVVTVPAIWRQPAKQFMRAAAYEAGIASPEFPDQLLIALEPEAASIYCRRLRMHQLVPEKPPLHRMYLDHNGEHSGINTNTSPAIVESKGTRYMVVDCGGGTVDITVHELLDDKGSLKELHKATGGPYGSVGVDTEFENMLAEIFSVGFLQQFREKRPVGFVDLMIAFEARKRNASPYNVSPLNISLPFSFIDYYKKCKGSSSYIWHGPKTSQQVESALRKYGHKDVIWSSQGMLRLEQPAMARLFQPTVQQIKQHIADVLNSPQVKNITYLFLVGGFAESQILQKEIRDTFTPYLKVIIPQGVSLAILTGAVLFGLDPTVVNIRRSRLTYGVGVLNRFVHGQHPLDKLVIKDGVEWCADVFDRFVLSDQSVGLGEVVVRSYTPAKQGQKCSIIHIYCSERHDAQFITDEGVYRCGTLSMDLTETNSKTTTPQPREIQTRMTFGDTEIKVSALDVATGKCVRAEIDFLNQ